MESILSDKVKDLLSYRISEEENSSRLYFAMYIWLNYHGFAGAAKLWKKYASEEAVHADWVYSFLLELDVQPDVQEIKPQPKSFEGLVDIIEKSIDHELLITKQCNELYKVAMHEGDALTVELALRFQKEQVEEIGKVIYWRDRLEAFGDSPEALRLLDNEMGCKA